MLIKGIQRLSTIDYPDKLACILFTGGCNFRCKYCHNPELIPAKNDDLETIAEEQVFSFLESRQDKLEGVSITGGEPTLHADLPEFIAKIKAQGFLVKLDTNGTNPEMLKRMLDEKLLDYVAMDIKHSLNKYAELSGFDKVENIQKSIELVMSGGADYEFRSTILPDEHSEDDLAEMAKMIQGAKKYFLQNFRPGETLDESYRNKRGFTPAELKKIRSMLEPYVKTCAIRDWQD